jgi:hypothetical protein
MEHLGTPSWSPDGQTLAVVRTPTGGGTAAGDIWLVKAGLPAPAPGAEGQANARPLAVTPTDERAPRWSPDGRQLAYAMEGDLYVADLGSGGEGLLARAMQAAAKDRPPETLPGGETAPAGLTAPETIWVLHDASGNTCRNVPDGQIDAIPFEQYVKRVTPYEVHATWPTETLKTQAVAARTYGWRKSLDRPYPQYPYAVKDSTADQYMCDGTDPRTDDAVDATAGQYVAYEGKVVYSFYCAETGNPTNRRQQFPTAAYLRPVNDPVSLGKKRHGHGWGLSQWGAYRWASGHGWSYPQILAHYYSGATVEPSTAQAEPLAAVVLPRSNSFITRDTAYLRALASSAKTVGDDSGVLTVTLSARVTDTWTIVHTATNAAAGWATLWPVRGYSDTISPSVALKAEAYDLLGNQVESALSYVGLNRSPPTGTLRLASPSGASATQSITPTALTTLTVALAMAASDPSPTHLALRASLGLRDWTWEDHELASTGGAYVTDTLAGDGSAWHVRAGETGRLVSLAGHRLRGETAYRLSFHLRVPSETLSLPQEVARLAVLNEAGELTGVRYLRGTEIKAVSGYQKVSVDAVVGDEPAWWRLDSLGVSDLWLDRISVAEYPRTLAHEGQSFSGQSASSTVTWTLPPREGPATIVARFVDGADNTSAEATVSVIVSDVDPPAGWREFQCARGACRVQVRDTIAGLNTSSAVARFSLDEGLTWGKWLTSTCSGEDGSHDWETLSIVVPLDDLCPAQFQFRVFDLAADANEGLSPVYAHDLCHRIHVPLVLYGRN